MSEFSVVHFIIFKSKMLLAAKIVIYGVCILCFHFEAVSHSWSQLATSDGLSAKILESVKLA